jgi:REP element-mobilizing transposase RayT
MPRFARLNSPGSVVHIVSNFVNDAHRMVGPSERYAYLARVGRALEHTDWSIIAYALMSSHIHLAAIAGKDPSSSLMRRLNGGYANWLNIHQGTRGPVFADRHYTVFCDDSHAARLVAYIHNNPVEAHVVDNPAASDWTSHAAYLGLADAPAWLDIERGLSTSGFGTTPEDRLAFHRFVRERTGHDADDFEAVRSALVRRTARQKAGSAVEISSLVLQPNGQRAHLIIAPSDAALRDRWDGAPRDVLRAVASRLGLTEAEIRSPRRSRELVEARRLAMDVWTRGLGGRQSEMSAFLGMSRQAASQLLTRSHAPSDVVSEMTSLLRHSSLVS